MYIMSIYTEWLKSRSSRRVNLNRPGECPYFWQKEQYLVRWLIAFLLTLLCPECSRTLYSFSADGWPKRQCRWWVLVLLVVAAVSEEGSIYSLAGVFLLLCNG